MIFYFSGTGNSFHVAAEVAKSQGELPVSIVKELDGGKLEYRLKKNELVGFVYPIYAWAPPKIILDFIKKMKISGEKPYVFSISTCAGNEGNGTHLLQKALSTKGLTLDSAFSVLMPSNYVTGADVCAKDEAVKIVKRAEERIKTINAVLEKRQTGVFQLIPGEKPFLHTSIINPLFNRFGRSTKNFYATDACTHCGLCEKLCPVHTITVGEKPAWGKSCTQCQACINRCPAKAIQYGAHTAERGRYVCPDESSEPSVNRFKTEEIFI